MGYSEIIKAEKERSDRRKAYLRDHPNYEFPSPKKGESQIAFALRCAAHLLSPPQQDGESQEIECVEAAAQIKSKVHIKAVERAFAARQSTPKTEV